MGCAGSVDKKGRSKEGKKSEEPELNGKVKFLSCPSISEILHPETKERYFLMAFAPQTHHGLMIVARDMCSRELFVKDIIDSDLAKEKEAQNITLSWNLFFKAVSSEISKANKTGAKFEFTDSGIRLEVKITIAGQQPNKRVDMYSCLLSPVAGTPENMYKYIIEPLATHYCRKRTDLSDRPDPVKDKQFCEVEVGAHHKTVSIAASQKRIQAIVPKLITLREEVVKWEADAVLHRGKLQVMRAMVKEKKVHPQVLVPDDSGPSAQSINTSDAQGVHLRSTSHLPIEIWEPSTPPCRSSCTDASLLEVEEAMAAATFPSLWEDPDRQGDGRWQESSKPSKIWDQLLKFHNDFVGFDAMKFDTACGGHGFYVAALFVFYYYGFVTKSKDLFGEYIDLQNLKNFLYAAESLNGSRNAFHNSVKGCDCLQAIHHYLKDPRIFKAFRSHPEEVYGFLLAIIIHDIDHPGLNNSWLVNYRSFLCTTYANRSPLEHHHVAVGLELMEQTNTHMPCSLKIRKLISSMVLLTDYNRHGEVQELFQARAKEIADFGRQIQDRSLLMACLLKCGDFAQFMRNKSLSREWMTLVTKEYLAQGEQQRHNPRMQQFGLPEEMDERKFDKGRWEVGYANFGHFVVIPLMSIMVQVAPSLRTLEKVAIENCA